MVIQRNQLSVQVEEAIKKNNGKLPTQKEDSYVNGIYQEFQKFLKGKKKNKSLTQAHLDRFQRILQMYVTPMKAVQVRFEKIKKRVEQEGIIQRGSGIASDLDYIWIRNHRRYEGRVEKNDRFRRQRTYM